MPKEPLLESPDFSQSCVPAFWPMAMGAALLKAGGDLYAKNLKFVDEETKNFTPSCGRCWRRRTGSV